MAKTTKQTGIPKFTSETQEAKWWASDEGRAFVKAQSAAQGRRKLTGSPLVAKLVRSKSVQIAIRLAERDIRLAREVAERKGIGYQTLIKMIVHEGLQRADLNR